MQQYLTTIMQSIGFPREAQSFFLSLYADLNEQELQQLEFVKQRLFIGKVMNGSLSLVMKDIRPMLDALAETRHLSPYSMDMLLMLLCTRQIEENYRICGYTQAFFLENMQDITNKLMECKKMYHVWGTSTLAWFYRLIQMSTLMLGRFQYEYIPFRFPDYTFQDMTVKTGDMVYNIHIPSSTPLTDAARMDSYKRLFDFVKTPETTWIPITCSSWLLYPDNREVYSPNSNLMGFLNDFVNIARSEPSGDNLFPDAWRVFYRHFTGDVSSLPTDTSLQRSCVRRLAQGKGIGGGTGILLFDGEKILNK